MTVIVTPAIITILSAGGGVTGSVANDLALAAILSFLLLVLQKEAAGTGRARALHQAMNIGILPLGLVCLVIATVRIWQVYQ